MELVSYVTFSGFLNLSAIVAFFMRDCFLMFLIVVPTVSRPFPVFLIVVPTISWPFPVFFIVVPTVSGPLLYFSCRIVFLCYLRIAVPTLS